MTTNETNEVTFATVEDYRAADAKGKAAIRKAAEDAVAAAIKSGDIEAAQAAQAVRESYTVEKAAKVEVNLHTVVSRRIAVLMKAASMLADGEIVPEGFPEDFTFDPEQAEVLGDEVTEEAAKMAGSKVTRSGNRSDIAAAIQSVFADLPKGTFLTVAEITNKAGLPSGGAVAARLFPAKGKCTVEGIVPVKATADAPKGARKA